MVALLLARSVEYVVAQWGVQLCGAAYVLVDHECPAERVRGIIADAEPLAVIHRVTGRQAVEEALGPPPLQPVLLGADEVLTPLPGAARTPARPAVRPSQLAYVILSSGSTGQGSAIMVANEIRCNAAFMNLRPATASSSSTTPPSTARCPSSSACCASARP